MFAITKFSLYRGSFPHKILFNFITGVKKIVRFTEDFVIKRFVISRFSLMYQDTGTVFSVSFILYS